MKNLKIGKKLGISFIILLMLAVLVGSYSLYNLRKTGKLSQDLFEGPYKVTSQSMGIRRDLASIGRNINNGFLANQHTEYRTIVLSDFDSISKRVDILRDCFEGNEKMIDVTENSINDLRQEYEKIYEITQQESFGGTASEIDDTKYYKAYEQSIQNSVALYENAEVLGIKFNEGVIDTVSKSWIISVSMGLFTILVAVVICIYIIKSLKQPIEEIEIATKKISVGDFDIMINYESEDELGNLSNSMRNMSYKIDEIINDTVRVLEAIASGDFDVVPEVEYIGVFKNIEKSVVKITTDLSETISQINDASEEVKSASNQVSSGSQILAQGSTEQAISIQLLSETIIDISDKIQDTANNAKEANDLSVSAGREVEDGNKQMKEMVRAMEEISFTSNEISRIIKTIDGIAFQTNILALNAAVEAARAGSLGKGFAVVADEVRNLAAKSTEAAKSTSELIENSIKAVNNGSKIVDYTSDSLQKITKTTNKTILLVDGIARASDEQASAISQVTLGIEQISDVVQTNSKTSEESAAASEKLSGQVHILKSLIEKFRLKDKHRYNEKINFNNNKVNYFDMDKFE